MILFSKIPPDDGNNDLLGGAGTAAK